MLHLAPNKLHSTLGLKLPPVSPSFLAWPPVQACFQEGKEAAMLCRDTKGPNTNSYIWNSWDELP